MRNLLLFFIATICGAATLPLYIDTDTNTVVSPDAPTTLDGYGITDAVGGTPTLDAFLVGDGAAWVTQSGQTAQESLGVVTGNGGGQVGASATATTGFAGGSSAQANGAGRVQLGTGTNSVDNTIQFLNSGSVTAAEFGILSGADTDLTTLSLPANTTISTFGASLVDDADAAAASITLGVANGGGGGQVGNNSSSTTGGAIGSVSTTTTGGAVGKGATSTAGGAIGNLSTATTGGAVGDRAKVTDGFAGGQSASANGTGRVQLGTGTNSTDNTIQFLSSGSVTAAEFGRLAVSTTAATGSTYTVLSTDHVILANNSGGVAVALISAASAGDGFRLVIKNTGTGAVTIDADGAETIDGALTAILTNQYESITIVSDGLNWFIL